MRRTPDWFDVVHWFMYWLLAGFIFSRMLGG